MLYSKLRGSDIVRRIELHQKEAEIATTRIELGISQRQIGRGISR